MMHKCRYFNTCNAPICPLDPDMKLRVYVTGEPKCRLDKRTRKLLGKNLPNKGLFPREHAGKKIWASLDTDTQQNITKFGKKNLITLGHGESNF